MSNEESHTKIGLIRKKYQKGINDLYIWTTLVRNSMEHTLSDTSFFKIRSFIIPSKKEGKTLEKNPEQLKSIIQNAYSKDIIEANFVYAIAQYESFFQEIYSNVLEYRTNLDESSIEKKVLDFTFLSPIKQFELFEQYINPNTIDVSSIQVLIELKASRDLIVHNDSTINKKYIDKTNGLARGNIGDKINIDVEYFEIAFATIKSIIGQITSQLQRDLK